MLKLVVFALLSAASSDPVQTQDVVIDRHATIIVPKEWRAKSFSMPIKGSSNMRIEAKGLKMAITGIPAPTSDSKDDWVNPMLRDVPPEKKLEFDVMNASMPYVMRGGKEYKTDDSVSFISDGYMGASMTLTSPSNDAIFEVFPGSMYRCVTTAIVKSEKITYVISIGSDACDGDSHKAALAAARSLKLGG